MSKILLYVDAENVSFDRASQFFNEAFSLAEPSDIIIGKCYGRKEHLGSLIRDYVELGFEFVDSGIFTEIPKNITDMKLITDCLYDVFGIYEGDIKAVYVLSDDCDFNPLLNKLRSGKFILKSPTTTIKEKIITPQMLSRALRVQKFYPLDNSIVSMNIYEEIIQALVGLDYEELLVEEYLSTRIQKLFNYLFQKFAINKPVIDTQFVRTFTFSKYLEIMKDIELSLDKLITIFTTKMFGETLKISNLTLAMGEINNWKGVKDES